MKKFLSLVLALVMTASLVTVSAAETKVDFTDDSSITYTEAVDVMTAIGVVGGYTDGSFAPNGTLTRGAAAKIICNMILGPTTAGALSADTAPFKDVPVSHTFAGYIAYCAQEGIISGYADGTFQPANTLTGYAFMKMLLGALGYDSKVEGYVGANWSVAVAKRALSIDLDEDLEGAFVGSKALTREEACLYAFNTLQATMVEYDSTIIVGDVTIAGSKAKAIYENTQAAKIFNPGDGDSAGGGFTLQFAEKSFTNLRIADETKYGHLNRYFTLDGERISDNRPTDTTLATSMDDTTFTNLTTKGKESYIGFEADDEVVMYVNGTAQTDDPTDTDGVWDMTVAADVADLKAEGDNEAGMGVIIEFIDTSAIKNNKYDVVNIIKKGVYTLTGDSATKEVKNNDTQVKVPGISGMGGFSANYTVENVVGYEGLKKGDVVLSYQSGNSAGGELTTFIEKAESVQGVASGMNGSTKLTVSGTQYKVSNIGNTTFSLGSFKDFKNTYTFYLDNAGGIVKAVKDTNIADNYAYVLDAKWVSGVSMADSNFAEARLLKMDGTVEVVKVSKVDDKKTVGSVTDGTKEILVTAAKDAFVTYKVSDGKYQLTTTNVDTIPNDNKTVVNGAGSFVDTPETAVYGNGSTIFLVNTDTTGNDPEIKVYTGVANVPKVTGATTVDSMVKDGIAKYVYILAADPATVTGATGEYVYIPGVKENADAPYTLSYSYVPESEDGEVPEHYLVPAIVNGKEGTLKVEKIGNVVDTDGNTADDDLKIQTMYKVVTTDNNGIVTLLTTNPNADGDLTINTGVSYADGVVKVDTASSTADAYNVNSKTEIYYIDVDGVVTELTYDSIQDDKTDKVYVVKAVSDSGNTADIIYIVEKISDTPNVTKVTYIVNNDGVELKAAVTADLSKDNGYADSFTVNTGKTANHSVEIISVETDEGSYALKPSSTKIDGSAIEVTVTAEDGKATGVLTLDFSSTAPSP